MKPNTHIPQPGQAPQAAATTDHAQRALELSPTDQMTVAEVEKAIREGRMPQPATSYLCKDGYYTRP